MPKLLLIRPSIDYTEIPHEVKKFFPPPSGNYYREPPIGPLYVASSCLKKGIQVKLIDQHARCLSNDQVLSMVNKWEPDFVGFYLTSFTMKNSIEIARKIKDKNRGIVIIGGGPWTSLAKDKILENNEFDFAIYGEGEITLPDLIKNYKNKKKLYQIDGLIFRDKGKIIINKPRQFIEDLDTNPYPAYQIIKMDDYSRGRTIYVDVEPVDYISATRGCPYACAFCGSWDIWRRKYRTRNPAKVVEEMAQMMEKYGTKGFHFRDDSFTIHRKFILGLCEELKRRNLKAKWMCETRVDSLDEEIVKNMKEAGCTGVWFGIESGSQKILNYLNKGITLAQIRKTVKLCKKYGLRLGGSFMLGVPIETRASIKRTIDFAKSLNLDNVWFNQFMGEPICRTYEEIKEKKLYQYEFNGNLIVETPRFSSDKMYNIVRRANFYFELKRLRLIIKTHQPEEYPKMALYALRSLFSFLKK
jgi:anaerobic magnesium-protoporphyrin IX monomethyl ester cyclase